MRGCGVIPRDLNAAAISSLAAMPLMLFVPQSCATRKRNERNAASALLFPATKEMFNQFNRGAALDDVIVLSPTLILNLRYGIVSADFPETRVRPAYDALRAMPK